MKTATVCIFFIVLTSFLVGVASLSRSEKAAELQRRYNNAIKVQEEKFGRETIMKNRWKTREQAYLKKYNEDPQEGEKLLRELKEEKERVNAEYSEANEAEEATQEVQQDSVDAKESEGRVSHDPRNDTHSNVESGSNEQENQKIKLQFSKRALRQAVKRSPQGDNLAKKHPQLRADGELDYVDEDDSMEVEIDARAVTSLSMDRILAGQGLVGGLSKLIQGEELDIETLATSENPDEILFDTLSAKKRKEASQRLASGEPRLPRPRRSYVGASLEEIAAVIPNARISEVTAEDGTIIRQMEVEEELFKMSFKEGEEKEVDIVKMHRDLLYGPESFDERLDIVGKVFSGLGQKAAESYNKKYGKSGKRASYKSQQSFALYGKYCGVNLQNIDFDVVPVDEIDDACYELQLCLRDMPQATCGCHRELSHRFSELLRTSNALCDTSESSITAEIEPETEDLNSYHERVLPIMSMVRARFEAQPCNCGKKVYNAGTLLKMRPYC